MYHHTICCTRPLCYDIFLKINLPLFHYSLSLQFQSHSQQTILFIIFCILYHVKCILLCILSFFFSFFFTQLCFQDLSINISNLLLLNIAWYTYPTYLLTLPLSDTQIAFNFPPQVALQQISSLVLCICVGIYLGYIP